MKVLIGKIPQYVFIAWRRKKISLIEDKRKDETWRAHTRWNPKRHIPLVSLLLWLKMVAVHCFVWPLALRLRSGRQAGSQTKVPSFSDVLKNSISGSLIVLSCF